MKYVVLPFLFVVLSAFGFAPETDPTAPLDAKIIGLITDVNSDKPIEFATISLHNKSDEQLITGTVADLNGRFELRKVAKGSYFIRIGFIGYETREIDLPEITTQRLIDLGKMPISMAAQNLDAIEIQGEKKVMETFIDKRVFNVSKDPTSQGGTGVDAMRNVPGVEVDVDGNISLRGDGNVRILVDGRPLSMSANQFLEQTPSSSIEKIEIITNPSAKYDPEGTTGILNIILKKDKRNGLFGSANVGFGYGLNPKSNNSVALNYRSGKVSLKGNLSGNFGTYGSNGTNIRDFAGDVDDQTTFDEGTRTNNGFNSSVGIDYFASDKDVIYAEAGFRRYQGHSESTLYSDWTNPNGGISQNSMRQTKGVSPNSGYNLNAGYQKKFEKEGHTLDLDWTFNNNYSEPENTSVERFFNGNLDTAFMYRNILDQFDLDDNRVSQLKLDYVLPINDSINLEAGYMHTWNMDVDKQLLYNQSGDSSAPVDDTIFSEFSFVRNTHAAYGIVSGQWDKIGIKAGLRLEQTTRNAELFGEKIDKFEYLSLFPSFHLSYKVNAKREFIVSASRRLNRPRGGQLNPFADYSNPYTLRTGNPFLKPEYVQVYELGIIETIGKLNVSSTLYHRYLTGMIRRVLEIDENNVNRVSFANQDEAFFYGLETNLSYRMKNQGRVNLNVNMFMNKYDENALNENENSTTKSASFNLMYSKSFSNGWSGQLSGRYRAPMDVIQGRISGMGGIDLGVRKSIWDNKGSIGIRLSDMFNMRQFTFTSADIGYLYEVTRDWESRVAFVTFSYNFGKRIKGQTRKVKREQMDSFNRVDF